MKASKWMYVTEMKAKGSFKAAAAWRKVRMGLCAGSLCAGEWTRTPLKLQVHPKDIQAHRIQSLVSIRAPERFGGAWSTSEPTMLASSKESEIAPQLAEPQCYPCQLSELLLETNLSKKGEQQWRKNVLLLRAKQRKKQWSTQGEKHEVMAVTGESQACFISFLDFASFFSAHSVAKAWKEIPWLPVKWDRRVGAVRAQQAVVEEGGVLGDGVRPSAMRAPCATAGPECNMAAAGTGPL